jgi:translation initiation factor 2B subunit (eIF-2B alpha/beta/delta family)
MSLHQHINGDSIFDFLEEELHKTLDKMSSIATKDDIQSQINRLRSKVQQEEVMLHYLLSSMEKTLAEYRGDPALLKKKLREVSEDIKTRIESEHSRIAAFGNQKIKGSSNVLLYGANYNLLHVLLASLTAKTSQKFHVLDNYPFWSGKEWLAHLQKARPSIIYHAFAQINQALEKSDVVFIGCDFVTKDDKMVCVVGTNALTILAKNAGVPVYLCTHTWTKHPHINSKNVILRNEHMTHKLISTAHKHVVVDHSYHELVDLQNITGVICEHGIFPPGMWKKKF